MVRYAERREAIDAERSPERYDSCVRAGKTLLYGLGGLVFCWIGSLPAAVFGWFFVGNEQLRRRVQRLRDVPERHPQHACRLTLSCEDTIYGTDEGLVSFVDGSMLFEGRRTSFSIPRSNAAAAHLIGGSLGFQYVAPAGKHTAVVHAIDRDAFKDSYGRWLRDEAPLSKRWSSRLSSRTHEPGRGRVIRSAPLLR